MEPTQGTSYPTGGGDTITARDLLQVLQEKDRLLATLLERLTVAGVAQPQPAPTFQVIPDLRHNISAFDMTREETVDSNHGTDRRQPLPPINQHGERKCYNCNIYGHIARDCPEPKRPFKCQRCQATGQTQRNCQAFSSNESNVVAEALPCTGAGHVMIKEVIFNDDFTFVGLINTGSSGCLLRASAVARCGIDMVQEPTDLYGFGSEHYPVTRSLGHCKAKVSIDGVVAENIPVLIVPDYAQRVDILVGRTFTELPSVTYAKVGSTFRFYHLNDCPSSVTGAAG
ncbi:hypothetical protein MTO96_030150 [Rhipicephalus appendiculatus]